MLLKVLWSNKPSGDGPVFQVWRYLNSLIKIKLPFSKQENLQIFPTSLAMWSMYAFLWFHVRDAKNIFDYQREVTNYTDQVLNFLLFDKHKYKQGILQSVVQVVYLCYGFIELFLCFSRFDWQNQFLFSENNFSEKFASYWLLTLYVTIFSDVNKQPLLELRCLCL